MLSAINLNADLGESFGAYQMGDDARLLGLVRSANIACGFHAGDPLVMQETLALAAKHKVSIGAHPSYPDLVGFGRRKMQIAPNELQALLCYQMAALAGMAAMQGLTMTHVKVHGALSNQACVDEELAQVVAKATYAFDRELILLAPACSALVRAGQAAGLVVAEEIFADRAYADDGQLLSRHLLGAVLHDSEQCVAQVLRFLEVGGIISQSGCFLPCQPISVCVHGDNAGSVATAQALVEALQAAGVMLKTLPELCKR